MIRLGHKIRLSRMELKGFQGRSETNAVPTTAAQHDALLEATAQYWEQAENTAEGRLLAAVTRFQKIDSDDDADTGNCSQNVVSFRPGWNTRDMATAHALSELA